MVIMRRHTAVALSVVTLVATQMSAGPLSCLAFTTKAPTTHRIPTSSSSRFPFTSQQVSFQTPSEPKSATCLQMSTSSRIVNAVKSSFSKKSTQAAATATASGVAASSTPAIVPAAAAVATAAIAAYGLKAYIDNPSRTYGEGTVAKEYDAWTRDGILEYYWGDHIHLGYYNEAEMEAGYKKKDFKKAKIDFIDEMMKLGEISPQQMADAKEIKVLDVGCGFGGTSRYLAKTLGPKAQVTGITLSPAQVERGTELAKEQNLSNVQFMVKDALAMDFEDNSFDVVWACESGEHMPDKKLYIDEMMRVLKPGGKFVMACWCQRDDSEVPFTKKDERDLRFLYEEWTHPYFVSIEKFKSLIEDTGMMGPVTTADWVKETIASWRHSIWVGVWDPRGFIFKPHRYMKCVRDAYCLERMHRAFDRGLMQYGMFAATKKEVPVVESSGAEVNGVEVA